MFLDWTNFSYEHSELEKAELAQLLHRLGKLFVRRHITLQSLTILSLPIGLLTHVLSGHSLGEYSIVTKLA